MCANTLFLSPPTQRVQTHYFFLSLPSVCKHIILPCVNTLLFSSAVYKTWVYIVEFVGSGKWTQHVRVAQDTILL